MDDFEKFKEDLKNHYKAILKFLRQAEKEALKPDHKRDGTKKLLDFIREEKSKATQGLTLLKEKSKNLNPLFKKALEKRTHKLSKEIEKLNKSKDSLVSDNILLEYKKKDLLLLTTKLEEANEEISTKNAELLLQQKKITEQAERLNAIHREILDKNSELEQQKESLLDQSDYLHEANQTITMMHQEVENQKDEILRKNEELLNLNNEKNNLIGIVAHDLKSPLNQMKGLLSIIKMNASTLDKETLSCINMMETSADRLTNLIAKILDVEAIESQKLNLIPERLNLSELLKTLQERFTITAGEKSITLHLQIIPDVYVLADKVYVAQVFENLISNAIKFSPSNKNIYIKLGLASDQAIAEIRDEGPGLTDDDKKKLFGKYQKLSARPTGDETSTGLGLSIVKKFVDAMSGKIWCESEVGHGAGFFVSFPIA